MDPRNKLHELCRTDLRTLAVTIKASIAFAVHCFRGPSYASTASCPSMEDVKLILIIVAIVALVLPNPYSSRQRIHHFPHQKESIVYQSERRPLSLSYNPTARTFRSSVTSSIDWSRPTVVSARKEGTTKYYPLFTAAMPEAGGRPDQN